MAGTRTRLAEAILFDCNDCSSPGAVWELQRIFELRLHRKLLLVFPPEDADAREERASTLLQALAATPFAESVAAAFLDDAKVCVFPNENMITVFFEHVPKGDETIFQSYDVCLGMAINRVLGSQSLG